ncbi:MAG: polysaccharide deacetylase family protein [Bacteroidales bacterium]|nr:polysaccharide deacetylase family protein [Bacteroidales bacterium]
MKSICFYFQVHQPQRLRTYRFFDIGEKHNYFDTYNNEVILRKVAEKNYLPMNSLLLDLIKEYGSAFKVSFSISGTALDQFEAYGTDVLESFKKLAETGNVEFLAETYAHSLSALRSKEEFTKQVNAHAQKIESLFGHKPTTFRNTELIYSDNIGAMIADMGYKVMLTEGAKHILGWRSPDFMYANAINPKLKLLLKNFRLSDDIAFRFSQQSWSEWPLTTEKFVEWLNQLDSKEEVVNLFMDYETFGEHQWAETGIFDFMRALPGKVFSNSDYVFATPSELGEKLQPVASIHVPHPISWADEERDLTAWLGNELQDEAFDKLYALEPLVKKSNNPKIQRDWLYLQTSDHFYYMCTKWFSDGDVHKYFNPYGTPYEAFINYMNVLSDFIIRLEKENGPTTEDFKNMKETFDDLINQAEDFIKKKVDQTKKSTEKILKDKELDFESIKNMSDAAIKKLLKQVDIEELSGALAGAGKEIRDKIIPNLGKQAQKEFEKAQDKMKNISAKDIEKYRKDIEERLKNLFGRK